MLANLDFHNPTQGILTTSQVVEEVAKFVKNDPGSYYQVIIGTDSQGKTINNHGQINYVTAIVVHRQGKGARYFWHNQIKEKIPVLREKIYNETAISLEVAQFLVPLLRKAISPVKYDFEIHIDVGPIGPTREMIKEVVGMVNGSGFIAKTKPESWGASSVADKHT